MDDVLKLYWGLRDKSNTYCDELAASFFGMAFNSITVAKELLLNVS